MNKEELILRLQKFEWKDVEFKKAQKGVPEDAYSSVSAFANTAGGWLVFGVKESKKSFEVVGVDEVDKVQNDFLSSLRSNNKLNHFISAKEDVIEHEGKTLLIFYIPESPREKKPVYLKGDIRQSYIRRGAGDERCTKLEIERFLRDASGHSYDNETVKDISAETFFDSDTIQWYRNIFNQRQPGRHQALSDLEFLIEWGFVTEKDEKMLPVRSGVLLFGKGRYIRQLLPRPILDYQRIDNEFEKWSPDERWHDRLVFEENIIQTWLGLVEKYMRLAEHPFSIDPATLRREDDPPDYISFREAAINLLIHQDYGDHNRKPVIKFFIDRTVFWNPGDAFITEADLLDPNEKEVRNPSIVNAFRRIGLSDQAGTGIRSIFRNWRELGNVPPVVSNDKSSKAFEIILLKQQLLTPKQKEFQKSIGVKLNKQEADVFAYAAEKGKITLTDVRALINSTAANARNITDRLIHQVLLKAIAEDLFELAPVMNERYGQMEVRDTDQETEQATEHVSEQVTEQVKRLLICLENTSAGTKDIMQSLKLKHRPTFIYDYLRPALDEGFIEMTQPDSPKSPTQKYRLTQTGTKLQNQLKSKDKFK